MTETDAALLVANDDEGCKTEATAALDDLGNAIDVNQLVNELAVALFTIASAIVAPLSFLCHYP